MESTLILAFLVAFVAAIISVNDEEKEQYDAKICGLRCAVSGYEFTEATLEFVTASNALGDPAPSAASCPNEWTVFENSCYALGSEDLTWTDAEEMCVMFGSTLVEVNSALEDDFIARMVNDHNIPDVNVWIGATDVFHEGYFEWSGSKSRLTYTNWAPNEPAGGVDKGVLEDCVAIRGKNQFKWNDIECRNRAYFVCEYKFDSEEEGIVG